MTDIDITAPLTDREKELRSEFTRIEREIWSKQREITLLDEELDDLVTKREELIEQLEETEI